MPADSSPYSSEDVLNDLDPLSRALLDLSIQKGMDDAEIAEVLGTDRDSVFEVRVGLLRKLAARVAPDYEDAELPELEAVVAERLYGGGRRQSSSRAVDEVTGSGRPSPCARSDPATAPAPDRAARRSRAAHRHPAAAPRRPGVVLIVALRGGATTSSDEPSRPASRRRTTSGAATPSRRSATAEARGTATIDDGDA